MLADPQMPVTSTLLDQAHNAIERKLFAMKGFTTPGGSQQAFLTGLVHLYNLVPYQRRAKHAGQCGVEVEGGRLPTDDWFLNLQSSSRGGTGGRGGLSPPPNDGGWALPRVFFPPRAVLGPAGGRERGGAERDPHFPTFGFFKI